MTRQFDLDCPQDLAGFQFCGEASAPAGLARDFFRCYYGDQDDMTCSGSVTGFFCEFNKVRL